MLRAGFSVACQSSCDEATQVSANNPPMFSRMWRWSSQYKLQHFFLLGSFDQTVTVLIQSLGQQTVFLPLCTRTTNQPNPLVWFWVLRRTMHMLYIQHSFSLHRKTLPSPNKQHVLSYGSDIATTNNRKSQSQTALSALFALRTSPQQRSSATDYRTNTKTANNHNPSPAMTPPPPTIWKAHPPTIVDFNCSLTPPLPCMDEPL